MLVELNADLLPCHQLAKSLLGSVAEWLALLGSVDPCDADSMLCTLSESRTVIVSPSAILTTVPSRMLVAEWEYEREGRNRRTKSRERQDRGLSIGNAPRRG